MITLSTIVSAVEQSTDGEKIVLSSLDYELCF